MQHVMMIESRDTRKTKHMGFFVNAGVIERVGEKEVKVRRKKAVKKKPEEGDDGAAKPDGGPAAEGGAELRKKKVRILC